MSRPRIGITTSFSDGRQQLDRHYLIAIEQAGGLPLIVPMLETEEAAAEFTEMLDGLIITGGPGITRGLVGKLPDDLPPVDPIRDRSDALALASMTNRPVLGICYGMQFINAVAGGTIYGDINASQPQALVHSRQRGGDDHLVQVDAGTHLARALGLDTLSVNSYHVQAVVDVAPGLRAVAFSPDGVIEGIESADGRLLGVQFHPERMLDRTLPLFKDFVARCR